mgnify:CR=1 FL=1
MNILCDLAGRCKIADLGLAKTANKEGQEFELEEELAENTYSNNNETREEIL